MMERGWCNTDAVDTFCMMYIARGFVFVFVFLLYMLLLATCWLSQLMKSIAFEMYKLFGS